MGYTKEQANSVRAPFVTGDIQITNTLSSSSTFQNIQFETNLSQVSMQSSGNLTFTYAPTLNGVNFGTASSTVSANQIVTYDASVVTGMQITWISGSGTVVLAGTA